MCSGKADVLCLSDEGDIRHAFYDSTTGGPALRPALTEYDEVGPSTADRSADVSFNEVYTASTDAGTGTMADLAATSSESAQTHSTRVASAKKEMENITASTATAQAVLGVRDLASWAKMDDATRPIDAGELLDGIPAVTAASQAWRQAFSAFCRLPSGSSEEVTIEVHELVTEFVTHGVNIACLIDMVQLQLKTIGAGAASRILTEEATTLHGLLDHLNIPATSQRLRDLLKGLKISAKACVTDSDVDFEVPIRHAVANAGLDEDVSVSPGHDDVYAHLRGSGYEVHKGEMIDAAADGEDDAMRFINPLLNGGFAGDIGQDETTMLPHFGVEDVDITLGDVRPVSNNIIEGSDGEKGPIPPSRTQQQVRDILKEAFQNEYNGGVGKTSTTPLGAGEKGGANSNAFKGGVDVVSAQAAAEGADIERIVVRNENPFTLDAEAIRNTVLDGGADNLDEIIAKAGIQNRVNNPQALVLPEEFKPCKEKSEKWTYQLLAESKPLMSMAADLVSACRVLLAAHLQNKGKPLDIEWAIVVDNSGSMVRVADECAQTVVILIEALRRVECRFAVATLGDANRTRILKNLTGHFNMSVGEQILAGFTYDESSHIATGVAAVANHVFASSRGNAEPHERRIMVLVTDGLSQELAERNFSDIRQKHDMELAVLHTQYGQGTRRAQHVKLLRNITNGL